jgi:hypothetical protein
MANTPGTGSEKTEETTESLTDRINQLQREVEKLKTEIDKSPTKLSVRIGVGLIIPGAILLILSLVNLKVLLSKTPLAPIAPSVTGNPQILAFIGLGLVFWGALFLLVRPISYVKSSLLDATAISTYTTIDRITKELKYHSKSYHIPPYPEEVYLPEHLKGLKETIVFISANEETELPSIEEIAKSRFMLDNHNGIIISPPGLGLVEQFEKELRTSLTKINLEELCEVLPKIILEDLQLAKEVDIKVEGNLVHLKITNSIYKALHREVDLQSVHFLGSPLESAIACAIAQSTGKPVTIQKSMTDPNIDTIEVNYLIREE